MVVQRWTNFLTSLQPSPRFQEEEARLGPSHLVPRLGNFMTSLSFCLAWFLFRLLRREYLEMRKGMERETFLFIKQILLNIICWDPDLTAADRTGSEGFRVSDSTH